MSEVIIIVVPSFYRSRQVEGVTIEKILLPAMVRKEQFALLCQVFIDAKTGFRGDDVIQSGWIEKVARDPTGSRTTSIGRWQVRQNLLRHCARNRNLVVRKRQATGLSIHNLRGGRIKNL